MTTGVHRGEMCAIRVSSVDLDAGRETIWLRRLDAETVLVLRPQVERCRAPRRVRVPG